MAGGEEMQFTGISKYYNSYTKRGRLNWVLTTYGTCAVAYLYFRRRGAKKAAAAASEDTSGSSSSCEQLK
ncbi:hypothetical protein EB796_002078 [Bugula neritina]|uniref:Uncharacterized protein n=1 Tax=Bugula neritina TaxID=10212 RepID=A0A7J7KFY2_BUGNE|nr:hypothetical protein EB796_004122 [Bugula neritina]KAF6039618.1 hypothetical protein EB796_002078 [Bugula neritina]